MLGQGFSEYLARWALQLNQHLEHAWDQPHKPPVSHDPECMRRGLLPTAPSWGAAAVLCQLLALKRSLQGAACAGFITPPLEIHTTNP